MSDKTPSGREKSQPNLQNIPLRHESASDSTGTAYQTNGEVIAKGIQIISEFLALIEKGSKFPKGSAEREANSDEAKAWMQALPAEASFCLFMLQGFITRLDNHMVKMLMSEGRLGEVLQRSARTLGTEKGNEDYLALGLILDALRKTDGI